MGNSRFKFRVWDDIHRTMENLEDVDVNPYNISDYPQNNIMQCTGLKDKNGKLIYEGDIVKCSQMPTGLVEWFEDGFWVNFFVNGAKRELRNLHNWFELIGNIYENEGLLNEQN